MTNISPQTITNLQTEILTWYAAHQRDLPWRKTREPYSILISEIMSQQTQISRVVPKYLAWMKRFPTVQALAEAETSEVLSYWSGLGYNRRAVNLQKAAQGILAYSYACHSPEKGNPEVKQLLDSRPRGNDGARDSEAELIWPRTVEELKKLPGVGEYTASAIACFAFDQQIPVIDTNVRKVILLKIPEAKDEMRVITDIAEQMLPIGKAYEWNQALMDYASAMLKHEKIAIPKQSTFKGSNRYYRGQTIKLLIENKVVSIKYLADTLGKDEKFIDEIILGLEKDGLIKRNQTKISFP